MNNKKQAEMAIQTRLGNADRIGSLIAGFGIAAYAILGDFEQIGVPVAMFVFGIALATIGGMCGT